MTRKRKRGEGERVREGEKGADFKITMADTRPRRMNHPPFLVPKSRLGPSVRSLSKHLRLFRA